MSGCSHEFIRLGFAWLGWRWGRGLCFDCLRRAPRHSGWCCLVSGGGRFPLGWHLLLRWRWLLNLHLPLPCHLLLRCRLWLLLRPLLALDSVFRSGGSDEDAATPFGLGLARFVLPPLARGFRGFQDKEWRRSRHVLLSKVHPWPNCREGVRKLVRKKLGLASTLNDRAVFLGERTPERSAVACLAVSSLSSSSGDSSSMIGSSLDWELTTMLSLKIGCIKSMSTPLMKVSRVFCITLLSPESEAPKL